jgi:hypothetical protein
MLGIHNVSLLKAVGERGKSAEKIVIRAFVFPSVGVSNDESHVDEV